MSSPSSNSSRTDFLLESSRQQQRQENAAPASTTTTSDEADDVNQTTRALLQQDHHHDKSASCSPETRRIRQVIRNTHLEAKRKLSQSSSQVSSSIVSTCLAESSRRSSSIDQCNLLPKKQMQNLSASRLQIEMSPLFNVGQNSKASPKAAAAAAAAAATKLGERRGTNLHRTISQSMLELDQSLADAHREARFFRVSWSNLSFEYKPSLFNKYFKNRQRRKDDQLVLNNLSGEFKSNQLIAIIGPSGCGKTTFLQFLAGNNDHSTDKLRISGLSEPKVAFIGQDDCLLPGLTAKETLMYASRLQNQARGSRHAPFDHEQHILPILSELGLMECSHRNVTKLSGGQAKRVTIAQELLYPTNLLILDEVTSGLDASTSYSIVKLLKYLVSDRTYPMSIVMSIHQPSARLFSVFDRVYLMSEGSCLYEGGCHIDLINEYLGQFALECPRFHNIADYLIEVASDESLASTRQQMISYQRKQQQRRDEDVDSEDDEAVARDQAGKTKLMDNCYIQFAGDREANGIGMSSTSVDSLVDQPVYSLYHSIRQARLRRRRPFWPQFTIHLQRSMLRIRRSYILTYLQLVTYIVLGLQLATFYGPNIGLLSGCPRIPGNLMAMVLASSSSSDQQTQDQIEEQAQEMRRIQENLNFLLVVVLTATFAALEITVITFPLEAKTIKREWRNGWYQVPSYFMGRTLADLPFHLVFVMIFCLLVFTMTGQHGLDTWRFGSFVLVMIMTALVAQSFGFIFGALFMDNLPAAVFSAPLCIFPTLLFSGFFARISQIPSIYRPMTYLSHFRYAFDALLVSLYGYGRCDCDQDNLDRYHASLVNQTETMRDMFRYLFGSSDCGSERSAAAAAAMASLLPQSAALVANEHQLDNQQDLAANRTATTVGGLHLSDQLKSFEDALVDRVFNHMLAGANSTANSSSLVDGAAAATTASPMLLNEPNSSSIGDNFANGITDHLAHEFSTKVTSMLNRQSNFGHAFPQTCDTFKSYLMTEFDLHNNDLAIGLLVLFVIVIVSRLVCALILNFTISARAK